MTPTRGPGVVVNHVVNRLLECLTVAEGGGWTVCDTPRLSAEEIIWLLDSLPLPDGYLEQRLNDLAVELA